MTYFQVPVLGFLFVSFRSTLIHSHSCSSGDSLVLSLSGLSASSSLSFVRVLLASSYLAFCFFRSLLPDSIEQWFPQCFDSSFRLPRFPPYLPSGFPYFFSGFRYLAFCLFPFVLPGFTPTAVSPVIPFFHFLASVSLSGLSATFRFSFVHLSPLQTTQLSDLSFPFFSISPVSGSFDACLPHPSCLLPCFPSDCGTQLPAIPFSDHCFVSQVLLQCLSFFLTEVSWFPLAYALGSGYSAFGFFLFRGWSSCFSWCFPSSSVILTTSNTLVNNFFNIFCNFFNIFLCNRLRLAL